MLKFNDYTTILVTLDHKNQRFNYYEDEVKQKNILIFRPYLSTKRIEEYKKGNTEYFQKLFNNEGCLLGELQF